MTVPELSEEIVRRLQTEAVVKLKFDPPDPRRYGRNTLASVIEGASEITRDMCVAEPCDNCGDEALLGPKLQRVRELYPDWPLLCSPCVVALGWQTDVQPEDLRIADELL